MIVTETKDRIARIEIARVDKKNALTGTMYDAMAAALAAAESDSTVRAVLKEAMSAFFEKRKPDFSKF